MPDYRKQVQLALERQRRAEAESKSLDRATARTPVSALTISDLAETISEQMRDQRSEILEHVGRLLTLVEIKRPEAARVGVLEDRVRKLYQRIGVLESEIRRLSKVVP